MRSAETLSVPVERVRVEVGDSAVPAASIAACADIPDVEAAWVRRPTHT
jgi:hypothetical protein